MSYYSMSDEAIERARKSPEYQDDCHRVANMIRLHQTSKRDIDKYYLRMCRRYGTGGWPFPRALIVEDVQAINS